MRFLRVLINLSDLPLVEDSPAEDRPAVRTSQSQKIAYHLIFSRPTFRPDANATWFLQQRSNCISWPGPAVYNQRVCPKRRAGKADPPRVRAYVWKKKKDYRAVLKEILDLLPSSISVRKVTLDFERAVWTVFRELLPDVAFQGCLFHWTQALWRKVRINYYQPSNKSTKRVKITNTKSIHTNGEKTTDKQTEKATLCD